MQFPQLKSRDGRVGLKVGPRRATLTLDGARVAGFDVVYEPALTRGRAEELASGDPSRQLVAFSEASPLAKRVLRDAGASYASEAGEIYIHAPPVHVEVPGRGRVPTPAGASSAAAPFGLRGGRIPRWLLLHLGEEPSFGELAQAVELSHSNVSRTVHALADEGLVRVTSDEHDARSRRVSLDRPARLLETVERTWRMRRFRSATLDVGARNPEEGERILRRSAERIGVEYAIGGLLGASRLTSAVQPVSVTAWIAAPKLERLVEALDGFAARPQPGSITLVVAPDPFVLSMGFESGGLTIADPVQLYLDCRRAGERGLDAAEAIRTEMGW